MTAEHRAFDALPVQRSTRDRTKVSARGLAIDGRDVRLVDRWVATRSDVNLCRPPGQPIIR